MTQSTKYSIIALLCCISAICLFTALRFYNSKSSKVIQMKDERELKVTMEAGYGNLYISKGQSSIVLNADMESDSRIDLENCIDYSVRDHVGYLNMSMDCKRSGDEEPVRHHKSIHFDNLDSRSWYCQFTDAVPIAFDIELGLGKGDINMTDLDVKDFSLSTGASSVKLKFTKPNKETIEDMNLEAGVSKFTAEGLCYARFHHLRFEGGVGSYTLDFGGDLDREVDADLEVGLGTLTIVIPENIGAKIYYEKSWIAHLDLPNDIEESGRDDNTYYSPNYERAHGKLNLHIDAGMGSVKIRRSND
ncbi:MAG: hypothetical protein ACHQQQ_04960 [Bacteroidota bacterium]